MLLVCAARHCSVSIKVPTESLILVIGWNVGVGKSQNINETWIAKSPSKAITFFCVHKSRSLYMAADAHIREALLSAADAT